MKSGINRVCIIVLDSLGIGALPDAVEYGDAGTDTLGHILDHRPLDIPNLRKLGLGNIQEAAGQRLMVEAPEGAFGRFREASRGKDTITGHWEIAGLRTMIPFKTWPDGFPEDLLAEFSRRIGRGILGNCSMSGTEIIDKLGPEHEETGKIIVYTSADSVFQIAANTAVVPLEELYRICETAREMMVGDYACGRVIARPYIIDEEGKRVRTSDRKDYSLDPPEDTMLDLIRADGQTVCAIGKISDIFNGKGVTEAIHTESNDDGVTKTIEALKRDFTGLIFTNLVDFDSKYGHRRDAEGYAQAIEAFDRRLPEIREAMKPEDLLILCADHGNDPDHTGFDHTREHVFGIFAGASVLPGKDLGTRDTFADIGATATALITQGRAGTPTGEDMSSMIINSGENTIEIITAKREGKKLTESQIRHMVDGYTEGTIPDYQMSAFLMAAFLRGLDREETVLLTRVMKESGDVADLTAIDGIKIDKHSTGGVGDKTTLICGPIAAACGVPVAKMSGRGLGFTGGTVDKMESIPGFQTSLPQEDFFRLVNENGISVIGQTAHIAPADKKIYALRDVTGTVDNLSLITSSVMSKKLASGADGILLDVKCGRGAFMKTEEDARQLAELMVEIGQADGKKTMALITDMNQPLGKAVGNALEIREVIDVLIGQGPEDITTLSLQLAGLMIYMGEQADTPEEGLAKAEEALRSGQGLEVFRKFVAGQGGDPAVTEKEELLPLSERSVQLTANSCGFVHELDAMLIGEASQMTGAGRETKEDEIDHGAGILLNKKIGDPVAEGEALCTLFGSDENKLRSAMEKAASAFVIKEGEPDIPALIHHRIGGK